MNNNKKIPIKNYVAFFALSIITIILIFLLIELYRNNIEYNNQNKNRMDFLSEIKSEEFNNYILENHDFIIYLDSSMNDTDRKYEKELKKYINKKNIGKDIVYLNSYNLEEKFFAELENKYLISDLKKEKINLKITPNILIIKEQKIVKVLYKKQQNKLNVKDAEKFLKKYWVDEL